ncbi:MAG: DUF4919 domain-containing protein [Planctomycetaceae bacterium]|nr:DUF4919 domain-containing protein [Planctomycetaceae bacterium]
MKIAARSLLAACVAALIAITSGNVTAEKPKDAPKRPNPEPVTAEYASREFEAFVKEPTKDSYLKVYRALTTSKDYGPYTLDLEDVDKLVQDQKFKEARTRLKKAMPALILSPRAHQIASRIAAALGDKAIAAKEAKLAETCIQGILSTGDGSRESPYMVTRVSDEYDVLRHLKKTLGQQAVLHQDGKSLDKIDCDDGDEICFDVTALFKSMK